MPGKALVIFGKKWQQKYMPSLYQRTNGIKEISEVQWSPNKRLKHADCQWRKHKDFAYYLKQITHIKY